MPTMSIRAILQTIFVQSATLLNFLSRAVAEPAVRVKNKSGSAARRKRELCDHMVDFKCILPKKSIALYQEMYHRRRITLNYMVGFEKRCTIKWFTWRDTSNYMVALKSFKPHQEIYPRKVRVVVPSVRLRTTALRPPACYIWTDNYRGSSSRRSITGCYMKR